MVTTIDVTDEFGWSHIELTNSSRGTLWVETFSDNVSHSLVSVNAESAVELRDALDRWINEGGK